MERAIGFARDVTMGLRADFPDVFSRAWPDGTRERDLARRVVELDRAAHEANGRLKAIGQGSSLELLQKLEALDLSPLATAASGLQALGDALRAAAKPAAPEAPKPRPASTTQGPDVALIRGLAPAPARQAIGPRPGQPGAAPGTTGSLARLGAAARSAGDQLARAATGQLGRAAGAPPGGTGSLARGGGAGADSFSRSGTGSLGDSSSLGGRRAFDGALKLAREVLAYVSPRLALADVALESTGLPGPRKPWPQVEAALAPGAEKAGVAPPLRPWLPLLAQLFLQDMNATRVTHQAVVHWKQAKHLGTQAEKVANMLANAPEASHAALLGSVDAGKLRAAVYPLSHLHVHFRGVQHLSTLFPAPS